MSEKKFLRVNAPPEKNAYKGMLSDRQVYGSSHYGKIYQILECTPLNNYQNFLYNRALFGLSVYTQEEITEMHWDKRKRIIKVHKRAQVVLNLWKQEVINSRVAHLFKTLFPKAEITSVIVEECKQTDPIFVNKMSFKDLGIMKDAVILKLMENGILPKDYYELKPQEVCK